EPGGTEPGARTRPPRAKIRRARQVQRLVDRRHRSRHALPRRAGSRLESVERRGRLHFHQSEQFLFLRADRGSRGPPAGRSQRAVLCRCTGLAAQSGTRQAHRHRYQRDLLACSGWALAVFDGSILRLGVREGMSTHVTTAAAGSLWEGGRSPFLTNSKKFGMWLFIISDSLTFSAMLFAY